MVTDNHSILDQFLAPGIDPAIFAGVIGVDLYPAIRDPDHSFQALTSAILTPILFYFSILFLSIFLFCRRS